MEEFSQFLTAEQFDQLTSAAMRTHMKKVECIDIMRIRADKYSSMGDHEKASNYLKRANELATKHLSSAKHRQVLLNKTKGVEILLRTKNTENLEQASVLGKEALDLAIALYGEMNLVTNHTMLTYALALGRLEETKLQSV